MVSLEVLWRVEISEPILVTRTEPLQRVSEHAALRRSWEYKFYKSSRKVWRLATKSCTLSATFETQVDHIDRQRHCFIVWASANGSTRTHELIAACVHDVWKLVLLTYPRSEQEDKKGNCEAWLTPVGRKKCAQDSNYELLPGADYMVKDCGGDGWVALEKCLRWLHYDINGFCASVVDLKRRSSKDVRCRGTSWERWNRTPELQWHTSIHGRSGASGVTCTFPTQINSRVRMKLGKRHWQTASMATSFVQSRRGGAQVVFLKNLN